MSDTANRETATGEKARGAAGAAAGSPAARLGGELRARRQSLGWELPDLAQSLRIRLPYLEAIEGGRMGELPGPTYALGFVRAYADALGLHGEQVAGRFRAETGEANIRPALSFPVPVPQRGVPAGALMLLGLVILAGAYSGWYYVSEHQRTPAETVPPIPDRLRPVEKAPSPQVASLLPTASAPAPQPPVPVPVPASSGAPATVQVPQASAPKIPAPAAVPGQPAAPALAGPAVPAASGPPPQVSTPTQGAGAPGQIAARPAADGQAITAPPAATAPAGTRIVIKANADAWVTVKQPGAAPALNRLMHAGETWPVPADKPGLLLTTGNAGGTELDVDGTSIATLGGSGAVRRDLKLDADALKAGPLPPLSHARRPAADQG